MTADDGFRSSEFNIRFKLRDIDKISPWGEAGSRSLSWYVLTNGVYCIDTPAGRLLEHTDAFDPDLGEPWVDYYVVRLFEDLCELCPPSANRFPSTSSPAIPPPKSVRDAIARFIHELLAAMAQRVDFIKTKNWQPEDGTLNIEALVAEQPRREEWAKSTLARVQLTDWDRIRRSLDQLGG